MYYILKIFVEISSYHIFSFDTDDIFKEINKKMNILKIDCSAEINNVIKFIIFSVSKEVYLFKMKVFVFMQSLKHI